MSTKRIADDPQRMKWCAGPCGRQLIVTAFAVKRDGFPQSRCRGCRSIADRERLRLRYRRDRTFRRRVLARVSAAYWRNPEPKRAYVAARAQRLKLTGATA